jgi:hypothetical protein
MCRLRIPQQACGCAIFLIPLEMIPQVRILSLYFGGLIN